MSGRRMKKRIGEFVALLAISIGILMIMAGTWVENYRQSMVVINEVCSGNEFYEVDNERITDYIELHNKGKHSCALTGLFLSDDRYNLKKLSLEEMDIDADGYLVISCEKEGNTFSIDKNGEYIYLSNEDGYILDQVEVVELEKNTSYVRMPETNTEWKISTCTPGMTNDVEALSHVGEPELSRVSGFYDEEFELQMKSANDTVIFYTLDGSIPDEGSYIYEGPITVYDRSDEPNEYKAIQNVVREWQEFVPTEEKVDKAFVIRAMAMDQTGNKSDVVTATYFINAEDYKSKNVISLVVDPKDLFDNESGIYVTGAAYDEWYLNGEEGEEPTPNFRQKGREWEREAVFEWFEDAEEIFQQDVGIRIQGASGRESSKKRFSIYARKEYSGSNLLEEPLFRNDIQSHSVVLRDETADVICQKLMDDRGIPYQKGRSVTLFLNGEYWYGSYVREKYNDRYFEDYYGIEDENLVLIEGNAVSCGVETDMVLFEELYECLEEIDCSTVDGYEEINGMMDIQNYIDFLITNIYCTNMDFDMEKTKNVVMWRSREPEDEEYGDGRWRFALYDMDSIQWNSTSYYGVENRAEIDPFSQKPEHADRTYNQGILYSALRKNDDFCKQFVLTCMDLINTNFTAESITEKWKTYGKNAEWLDSFFQLRPEYMKKYLAQEFDLSGAVETVTLKNVTQEGGTVTINTVTPVMTDGVWSGEYYTDYPITVTANPVEGYEFVGWSGAVETTDGTVEVPVTSGGITLIAEFQKME